MRLLVTGASGFIGGHVVEAALRGGHEVVALVRGDVPHVTPLGVSVAPGDVRDERAVRAAADGCDAAVHVAGVYTFDPARAAEMRDVNVTGTETVVRAALAAGVQRVVYTGTVGTTDFSAARHGRLPNEDDVAAGPGAASGPYKRSKLGAESVVARMARSGAPVVTVCPTAPVGSGDRKPTPTGRIVLDFMRRRMPAYVDTGLNFVHVRDVAEGHLLALEHGQAGKRYLLGSTDGNLTLAQTLGILSDITGLPAPRLRLHRSAALAAAHLSTAAGKALRRAPAVPLEAVRMASERMWVDPSRSVRELGLPQTPVREALAESVRWFAEHARRGRSRNER